MSYGLQCWDASGNMTLDVSDRLSKRLGRTVFTVYIPAKTTMANMNNEMWFELPANFQGSGLSTWVHPTESVMLGLGNVACTSIELVSYISGNSLVVRLNLKGYATYAETVSFGIEYGVY